MASEQELISFKTGAWQSGAMVASYAERMHENRGTNRLKNHVEIGLCRKYATGKTLVDVGVGTGRAALPLARDGFTVTGIDASKAMLDQCRNEAGTIPIDLREGDLTALPCGDETFDSLVSLNVAVHFPNWRDALREWARVVKPGGRLVFDVHSRDHLVAVAAAESCEPDDLLTPAQRTAPEHFMLRVTAREVAQAATALGLSIAALIPYAALMGGGNVNYWLRGSRLWGYLGDRALSWMALEDGLFELARFVEEDVIAHLSTAATGRFMVVLDKTPDERATAAVLARGDAVNAAFARGATLDAIREAVGAPAAGWAGGLRERLESARNRALLQMALIAPAAAALRPLIDALLGEALGEELYEGHRCERRDAELMGAIERWYRTPEYAEALTFAGVPLGPSLEYDLMRDLVIDELFPEART